METSFITTMGHTWKGESWMKLHGSGVGAGSLLSQKSSMPRPPVQWGTVSRQYWLRNEGGVLNRTWNSERPLVFAHVVLTKTLGVCRAREIQASIMRRMDLWERGLHAGLVGDAEAEETAR